ncbi:transglycosylase family protein [Streptomyces kronopolitis]|uniref:LysM peptidoglycan-binding domain-containing protein n=1 Tax=Streptomyces kronopolitis TaxID=1612435 RepID=UPI003D988F9E
MTGAGIALPLLGASGAHAADTTTWDKVAQCESGGEWSAAAGNGYYGGLQLTQEMWDKYGGSAYASRPDLASRAQQIVVAQSILDHRGPGVWTSCATDAGLARDGRAPEVNPGSTSTPEPDPSDGADTTDPWGSSGMHDGSPATDGQDEPGDDTGTGPSDEPTPSPASPDSGHGDDPSGTPDPSGPATSGDGHKDPSPSADPSDAGSRPDTTGTPRETPARGKHRGGTDHKGGNSGQDGQGDRNSKDGQDGQGDDAGRASRGGEAHRSGPAAGGDYTVRPGDSLSAIATAHRLAGGWSALYDRNEGVIGSDADLIQPGQVLDLGQNAG